MDNVEILNMEEVINSIPGVISSKIVLNEGEIEEMHVLASNLRGPKQISRDIQSALTAKFDVRVDYRKISIAQIDDKQDIGCDHRLKFDSIQYSLVGNSAEVRVLLEKEEDKVEGTAKGIGTKNNIYRLIAQATVDCVHKVLGVDDILMVEDVESITLAKRQVVVVAISYLVDEAEKRLTGSAIVGKDEYETVVRATLDAVNRKMVKLV